MAIGVWVGFDDERALKLTGAQAASRFGGTGGRLIHVILLILRRLLGLFSGRLIPKADNSRRRNVRRSELSSSSLGPNRRSIAKCMEAGSGNG